MLETLLMKRWLDWTIAIIVIVFILLMWAIQDYSIEQDYSFAGDDIYYSIRLHNKTQQQNTDVAVIEGTTNWKIYRNEKYGFELKYPADLTMESVISQMDFHIYDSNYKIPEGAVGMEIRSGFREIRINIRQKSEDWFARAQENMRVISEEYPNTFAEELMIIGGENAVVYTYINPGAEEVDATVANSRYVFYFESYQLNLAKDIFSTVKFFEPTE